MASPSTNSLTLVTSDDKHFTVTKSIISYSETINNLIDDDCASGLIPLPNVDYKTLEKVIEYCAKHTDETVATNELKEFDEKFVDVGMDDIYDLLGAANYLNIKSLLDVMAEKVASLIRGKSVEEIRETFGIVGDIPEEEEERVMKNNSWAFD